MSFQDDIRKIVQSAIEGKEERRRSIERTKEEWSKVRDLIVKPRMDNASVVLNEQGISSSCGRANGNSYELTIGAALASPDHKLSFTLDAVRGKIVCDSSEVDLRERYDSINTLTADEVEDKVKEFLVLVVPSCV